jgi:hypothetical protein
MQLHTTSTIGKHESFITMIQRESESLNEHERGSESVNEHKIIVVKLLYIIMDFFFAALVAARFLMNASHS